MSDPTEQALRTRAEQTERALTSLLGAEGPEVGTPGAMTKLLAAIRHGTLGGGKRLRPFLVMEAAAALGADPAAGLPAACAVEMVHSYSLVHDDLPAMDDAEIRRGRPSVHVAYGEATAILAGDALLTDAFGVLARSYPGERAARLVAILAEGAGTYGMVGGQAMDLAPDDATESSVIAIQARKTGALIEAACAMGGVIGGSDEAQMAALRAYARALGLAFQVRDDVLDASADAATLGKPAGRDEDAGKATFVGLYGLDGAQARVDALTDEATDALAPLPKPDALAGLAHWQARRSA